MSEPVSRDVQAFLNDVREVCRKHRMQLTADEIQVWRLRHEGEEEILTTALDDCTHE